MVTLRRTTVACACGLALATAASWIRFAVDGTLALDTHRLSYVLACAFAGVGLIVAGFAALKAPPADPREVLRAGLVVQLCALPAIALTSTDLFYNLAVAALLAAGRNPYLVGPVALGQHPITSLLSPLWSATPTPYGPLQTGLSALAGHIGAALASPVWASGLVFKVFLFAAACGTLFFGAAAALTLATPGAARGFAALALSPLLAWEISGQTHNDGLMVCALAVFAWAAASGRDGIAALALATGALGKMACAPVLVLWFALMSRRSLPRALLWAAACALVAVVVWAPFWDGMVTLRGPAATAGADIDRHARSLHDLLDSVVERAWPAAKVPVYRAFQLGSLAWLALSTLWFSLRVQNLAQLARAGTVVLLGYFLLTPWFQPWYATWLLPLVVLEVDERWQRLVAFYAVITVIQWAAPFDPVSTVIGNAVIVRMLWSLRKASGELQPA
jgi:alpha-1,6-mannosyltransferase